MPLLLGKNMTVKRGMKTIFSNVDLMVGEGEVVALTGVNGCGKSTLAECAAGMHMMRTGSISHRHGKRMQVIRNHHGHRGSGDAFGLTLQKNTHCGDELVGERLQIALDLAVDSHETSSFESAAQDWGLFHRLNDRIAWLSGGLARRVDVLAALLPALVSLKPRLIILDEPCSGLDDIATNLLIEQISTLASAGHGFLIATHNQALMEIASSKISWDDGQPNYPEVSEEAPSELAPSGMKSSVAKTFRAWANTLDYRTWSSVANSGTAGLLTILLALALSVEDVSIGAGNSWMMALISLPAFVAGLIPCATIRHLEEADGGRWWEAQSAGTLPAYPPQALALVGAGLTALALAVLPTPNWTANIDGAIEFCLIGLGAVLTWMVALIQIAQWRLVSSLERANAVVFAFFLPLLIYPFLLWTDGQVTMLDSNLEIFERFSNLLAGACIFLAIFISMRLLKPS